MCILMVPFVYYNIQISPVDKSDNTNIIVNIPKGVTTSNIGTILENEGVISSKNIFVIYNKIKKTNGRLQAGTYNLRKNMSMDNITTALIEGDIVKETVKFTIPEGFELRQIVDRLEELKLIDRQKFYNLVKNENFNYDFLTSLPKVENRLEGYLFPDTYEIRKGSTEKEIIIKMLDKFDLVFKEEYNNKSLNKDLTINEIITMASIIEREAKIHDERPIVSSVFYNRIDRKMKLQSCATVQYILKERKSRLTNKDIKIDSKYNTYIYTGLPKGPIASPGRLSIRAALNPQKTNFLYFVVSKNGKHYFNETYKEHLIDKNKS